MNKRRVIASCVFLYSGISLFAGCANHAVPARQALDQINDAIQDASPDAAKYFRIKFANVRVNQTELEFFFRNGNYETVIEGAPGVLAMAKQLNADSAEKKAQTLKALAAQWSTVDATMPRLVAAVRVRINKLAKARHKPRDVDLTIAESDLKTAISLWDKAESEFQVGDVEEALKTAKEAKPKAQAAAAALHLTAFTEG